MQARPLLLVPFAMLAFAGNSLLCRFALHASTAVGTPIDHLIDHPIDPGRFTLIRLAAGAATLCALLACRSTGAVRRPGGSWLSALALFGYAAGFSFAYAGLPAGTGALLLFGAVQATMIGHAVATGTRPGPVQRAGMAAAAAGLVLLVLPGLSAPSPAHAGLMLGAGVAWGAYSLRGRATPGDPTAATAGNFLRAVPLALPLLVPALLDGASWPDPAGVLAAALSGAVASGLGYAVWYAVLPALPATVAATVQLSVPVLAALAAVPLLGEPVTPRLLLASTAVLGGIALVIRGRPATPR